MEDAAFGRRLLLAYPCRGDGNGRICAALGIRDIDKKETALFSIYLPLAGDALYGVAVASGLCCVIRIYVQEKQRTEHHGKVKEIYRLTIFYIEKDEGGKE